MMMRPARGEPLATASTCLLSASELSAQTARAPIFVASRTHWIMVVAEVVKPKRIWLRNPRCVQISSGLPALSSKVFALSSARASVYNEAGAWAQRRKP